MQLVPPVINRVRKIDLETLEGYLERLRIANYYEEVGWYRHAVGPDMSLSLRLLRKEAELAALGSLTRLTVQEVYAHTLHGLVRCFYTPDEIAAIKADPRNREYGDIDAPLWPQGGINQYVQRGTKVCPECWREQRTTYLPWMLRPVTTCPRHNVLLLDRCSHPGCGAALVMSLAVGRSKGCLHNVATMPAESVAADPYSMELAQLMWASLRYEPDPAQYERVGAEWLPSSVTSVLPANNPLLGMTRADMHQFFYILGKALLPYGLVFGLSGAEATLVYERAVSKLRSTNNVQRHELYLQVWRVLRDWEHEWPAMLAKIAAYEQPIAASKRIYSFPGRLVDEFPYERWPWLHNSWMAFTKEQAFKSDIALHWLLHYRFVERDGLLPSSPLSPTSTPSSISSLMPATSHAMGPAVQGGGPIGGEQVAPPEAPQRIYSRTLLTMSEVAKELGLSKVATKLLVDRGTLGRVVRVEGGAFGVKLVLVDGDEVREYGRQRGPVMTLIETAKYLGMGSQVVFDLIKEGILPAESEQRTGNSDGKVWRIRRIDLDALVESVLGPLPACTGLCVEGEGDGQHASSKSELLTLNRASNIKGLRRNSIPLILRAVMSGKLRACRVEGTSVLADENANDEETRKRDGEVLRASASLRLQDLRIDRASIRTMLAVPLDGLVTRSQAVKSIGCHFKVLPLLIDAGLLVPVAGDPDVPSTWRYRQTDINEYLDRYIDGDAAAALMGVGRTTLYRWARDSNLPTAIDPRVIPYAAYRFDRHALLAWRRERLTASEASAMLGVRPWQIAEFARRGLVRVLNETNGRRPPRTSSRWYSRADVEALLENRSAPPSE